MLDTPLVTFARLTKSILEKVKADKLIVEGQKFYRTVLLKDTGSNFVRKTLNGYTYKLVPDLALSADTYEPHMIAWLTKYLKPQGVFWDVGANWGFIALAAARIVGQDGNIIAIEPSLSNLDWLKRHVEINSCAEPITVLESAVCERDGGHITFSLLEDGRSPSNSLMFSNNVNSDKPKISQEVTVPAISLDGLMEREQRLPDIVKIDVEGAELRVLQGATQLLNSQNKPIVILAVHPFWLASQDDDREIMKILQCGGYKIFDRNGNKVEKLEFDEYLCLPSE
jgi:FkbM family methyltransferase